MFHAQHFSEQEYKNIKIFLILWFGQAFSNLGNAVAFFAFTWWIWEKTKSGVLLAGYDLSVWAPTLVVLPIAGVCIDKWNRRSTLLVMDLLSGIAYLCALAFAHYAQTSISLIYIVVIFRAIINSFHQPALESLFVQLVPEKHLTRANGLYQISEGIGLVCGPLLGALLLESQFDIQGVFFVQMLSFWIAALTLVFVQVQPVVKESQTRRSSLVNDMRDGLRYLCKQRALMGLLAVSAISSFFGNSISVLLPQLFTDKYQSGAVLFGGVNAMLGASIIIGGIAITIWGGPKRRTYGAVGGAILTFIAQAITGVSSELWMAVLALSCLMMIIPTQNSASAAIWQSQVAPNLMGRVIALRRTVIIATQVLSVVVAGILSPTMLAPDKVLVISGVLAIISLVIGYYIFNIQQLDRSVSSIESQEEAEYELISLS